MTQTASTTTTHTTGGGTLVRAWVVGLAVGAILLGVIGFLLPEVALLSVALLFGIHLLGTGIFRLTLSFADDRGSKRSRALVGVLGALTIVAGVLCLSNPWESLVVLGIVIGLGWILDGLADLADGTVGHSGGPRWLVVASGIVSLVAGVIMLIIPTVTAVATVVLVGSIMLVLVGVATLLLLPARRRRS
jgi:uncharacterized membrane protein HdeD (DUF308 family)